MNKRQFKKHPELNPNNLKQWKKELDIISEPVFGEGFSRSVTDKEWFEAFLGWSPKKALCEELSYCSD